MVRFIVVLQVIAIPMLTILLLGGCVGLFAASRDWGLRDPEEERKMVDKYTK